MNVEAEDRVKVSAMDVEYIAGFEHGCDYLFNEIRRWHANNLGTIGDFVAYIEKVNGQNSKVH
jgi:hypothetical protein